MKKVEKSARWLLFVMIALCSLTSCEEDDYWMTGTLEGRWRVVEAYPYDHYAPPYDYGDIFDFAPDGTFSTSLGEFGYWEIDRGRLVIDFTGDGYPDVDASIPQIDDGYVVLDVRDSFYQINYRLRLVRVW